MDCIHTLSDRWARVAFSRWVLGIIARVEDIRVSRQGSIESITVTGEIDMSNVSALDDALRRALSGGTTSCLLDLSEIRFMDSSVVHALVRWSKEAQVSAREALAILVGGDNSETVRVLTLVGLMKRLPTFHTRQAAMAALELGQKPRTERPLEWLSDIELVAERDAAQMNSDAAMRRLDDAIAEQNTRRQDTEAAQEK